MTPHEVAAMRARMQKAIRERDEALTWVAAIVQTVCGGWVKIAPNALREADLRDLTTTTEPGGYVMLMTNPTLNVRRRSPTPEVKP